MKFSQYLVQNLRAEVPLAIKDTSQKITNESIVKVTILQSILHDVESRKSNSGEQLHLAWLKEFGSVRVKSRGNGKLITKL